MEARMDQNVYNGTESQEDLKDDNFFFETEDLSNNPTDENMAYTKNLQTQPLENSQDNLNVDGLYHHDKNQTKNELKSALIVDAGGHRKNYSSPSSNISNRSFISQRSFLNRTFGPLGKGSLRGSMFQLSAAAIGSGVLSLPFVIAKSGFILGSLMIIIACIAAIISLLMLAKCTEQIGAPSYTYLIRKVIARNVDKHIVWLIFFGTVGSSVSYQIIITQMIQVLATNVGFEPKKIQSSEVKIAIAAFIAVFILFPVGSMRKMSGFRYISILSIASLVYIMFVLLFELPQYATQNFRYEKLNYFKLDWDLFSNFSIAFFAFSCHIEFIPIYDEMNEQNPQKVRKLVYRSVGTNTLFFLSIGLAGYFSTYEKTNQIVIDREPLIGQLIDFPLMIGRIMIVIVLCIAFPINMVPLKQIMIHLIYSRKHQMTQGQNISMSLAFVMLTSVIAIIYPNITGILSIVGGICSVTICYVLPTMCYIKLNKEELSLCKKYSLIVFFGTLSLVGYSSVILKIILSFSV
ncbi:UNKNOWN [Stylonychia lemnae]|uniref:Amino acid transporter transmembrane domain-containing protein n=1 Tax=Stylonychia lemnae TaxID=5949 RepID=A0A078B1R0_STYLE|nr:UNKNOWN [Stylonychia lemnae]|eukprot:CDW87213.1 UNKNOWN [Stylonychia lemnae]